MNHLTDEQVMLLYYGEETASTELEQHLEACGECRMRYQRLVLVLNTVNAAPVPQRSENYGAEVWQRLLPSLLPMPHRLVTPWRWLPRWAIAGAIAALLLAAFLAGRLSHRRQGTEIAAAIPGLVKQRILLVAVGDHLDRSYIVLAELVNSAPKDPVDISTEQARAEELISANRLYRQTAASAGQNAVASVLDELERVLLDIAHGPSQLSLPELARVRHRIEEEGIIFKLRVIGSSVRQGEKEPIRKSL